MVNFNKIGCLLRDKRAARGLREVAKEVGVSPSTLSRVENGHVPDLESFGKLCKWLGMASSEFMESNQTSAGTESVAVHFKKKHTLKPETATALAELILLAQRSMIVQQR